jgi:hypothetical protein
VKRQCTIFDARMCSVRIRQKACRDTSHRTCVFSLSALWCVHDVKFQCTIFHDLVGPVRIPQKRIGTHSAELVFLHPGVSMGHVMRSGASGK